MSYIEENGYFIFDGIKSSDYGVWIHGGGTYNAPKRRYKDYTVPGRNGTLTIDEGVFEEIEVVYPAFIARDFPANIEAFRNELMSRSGYVRMTDSYHPDEYYMAKYMDGLDADVAPGGVGAQFNLTFKRDPRRFLVSGETPITIGVPIDIQTVSGSIVSIDADADTKITSVVDDINPVQDLHGYGHPWAGGNGKNLIPYPYYETTRTQNGITFTVNADGTVKVNGTATAATVFQIKGRSSGNTLGMIPGEQYIISGCPSDGSSSTYKLDILKYSGAAYRGDYGTGGTFTYSEDTADDVAGQIRIVVYSGTTMDNLVFKPMIRLASDTDATWQPYANVCPISGWTEANITRTGKNLIPYPYYQTTRTESGITWTDNGDGTITANGTATATSYFTLWGRLSGVFPNIIAGKRYILSLEVLTGTCSVYFSHTVGATHKGEFAVRNVSNRYAEVEFTAWEDEYDGNVLSLYINTSYGTQTNTIIKPMLRLASEPDATYEKYTAQKYTTALGRTVYGGTLDVVSGLLTVDKAFATLTGASGEDWRTVTQSDFVGFYLSNTATVLSGRKASGDIAVNEFVRVYGSGWSPLIAPGQLIYATTVNIRVNDSITTVEELRTWLANNPLEIAYELATPITYTLTPQEISTLIGTNNIWADTGDVSVEYGTVLSSVENPTLYASRPQIKITPVTNLINPPYYDRYQTRSGINYSNAGNGAIKVSGTSTSHSYFTFVWDGAPLAEGSYKLSGAPSGSSLVLFLRTSSNNYSEKARDTGNGITFSISQEEAQRNIEVEITIESGITIDATFTPLLELVSTDAKTVAIGSQTITVNSVGDYVIVDSEIQSCYRGTNNLNSQVIFSPNDFPTLAPGANNIAYSDGIGSVEITPNWYRV